MSKLRQAAWTAIHKINRSTGFDEESDTLLMEAASVLREALAEPDIEEMTLTQIAARHEQAEQEPFDMDDHPPHRLCECRKCMEYFTPLPDCDAFAASGKPIAEQTNTQFMEGYRIGLAEMREACAKVASSMVLPDASNYPFHISAAIRAIKFEGDTGFRPVSEMIAEHKQDPKKAAAIEKAKMRKSERKPVARVTGYYSGRCVIEPLNRATVLPTDMALYTAPVRTKDLTDDEIEKAVENIIFDENFDINIARAVIQEFRRKNGIV